MFLSSFQFKIDKKKRISLPQMWRDDHKFELKDGIYLYRSPTFMCLDVIPLFLMERLVKSLNKLDLFSESQDSLATTIFAETVRAPLDTEGRFIIPQSFLDYAKIENEALIIGLGQKMQIWNPQRFAERQEEARRIVKEKNLTIPNLVAQNEEQEKSSGKRDTQK